VALPMLCCSGKTGSVARNEMAVGLALYLCSLDPGDEAQL
jgi:hypothetical protein